MMAYTKEEELEIQGFKDGYFFMKYHQELLKLFLKANHHDTPYMKGIRGGTKEYEKEKNLQSRREKLKKISEQEKSREKNEFER